ncbi:MAG: DUF4856 domain-containing protein, partial [Flavobacteriales bacterium]|nr:DUF4856 domain-containing protein [Flavobacteriales bacterium]
MKFKNIIFLGCAATIAFLGCRKEGCTDKLAINFDSEAKKDDGSCTYDDGSYIVPTTYTFTDADGRITVSYSGQTDRLNMLQEMKDYMKTGTDAAVTLDVQKLKDMYANTNSPWTSSDLNASSKQLENKTFSLDMATFKSYLDSVASHSAITTSASEGVAGSLTSSDGNSSYLVDANGWEYPQLFEKGIMGSVFYYQIAEVYTRDGKIGATVNNTDPVDAAGGKYYTEMEHHWDEAFGYFGVPTDFPSNTDGLLHIGKYCNSRNGILTTLNQDVMDQYL